MNRRLLIRSLLGSAAGASAVAAPSGAAGQSEPQYPVGNVMRYGAKGDGVADDLHAFVAAHDELGKRGGVLTGPPLTYLLKGTLTITNPVALDFMSAVPTYIPGTGPILKSDTNAPILVYAGKGNRFVDLRNINILGNKGQASQDGVVVDNGGVRMDNVSIFNVGRFGLHIMHSYASHYRNLYISGCAESGVFIDAHCGGNLWSSITIVSSNTGFNIGSSDGSDIVIGLDSEQNKIGIVTESGVTGWQFIGTHTEWNSVTPALFKEKSDKNRIDFNSRGGGNERAPINSGGSRNTFN
jgi:hypothetical protein